MAALLGCRGLVRCRGYAAPSGLGPPDVLMTGCVTGVLYDLGGSPLPAQAGLFASMRRGTMTIDERSRHALFVRLEQVLGPEGRGPDGAPPTGGMGGRCHEARPRAPRGVDHVRGGPARAQDRSGGTADAGQFSPRV